jgi:hypothetical protein
MLRYRSIIMFLGLLLTLRFGIGLQFFLPSLHSLLISA